MPVKSGVQVRPTQKPIITSTNTLPQIREFEGLNPIEQQTFTALIVNNGDIEGTARDLGLDKATVYKRLQNSPKVKEAIHIALTTRPMLRLLQSADRVAEQLLNLSLKAKSENVQLEATKHALGIVGISPDKKDTNVTNIQLNNIIGQSNSSDDI